jgi:hypothetical protein
MSLADSRRDGTFGTKEGHHITEDFSCGGITTSGMNVMSVQDSNRLIHGAAPYVKKMPLIPEDISQALVVIYLLELLKIKSNNLFCLKSLFSIIYLRFIQGFRW